MAKVLLGTTGSVAAIMTPALFQALRQGGHEVKVVATVASLYFFDPAKLTGLGGQRNRDVVILDEDEWPQRAAGHRWQRGEPVVHIELRRWADLLLIAPLDANTLAKLALGICDNCLTCVWRAWDRTRPVVLAPAMNTLMWEHPGTARHLQQIADDLGDGSTLRVVSPVSKRLACDDVSVGAMASLDDVVSSVASCSRIE
jgi:phosphopantothenoylcysteine decarboxylase